MGKLTSNHEDKQKERHGGVDNQQILYPKALPHNVVKAASVMANSQGLRACLTGNSHSLMKNSPHSP